MSDTAEVRDDIMRMLLKSQDMLAAFLFSVVEDWEVVEEALQETTVYICGHWNEFTPGTNFGAWIRTVARMRCREVLRQKRRGAALADSDVESVADSVTQEEWEEHGQCSPQHKQALSLCLNSLPEAHRKMIEMHYLERQTCGQLAKCFNKTIDALYMTMSRIRKRLRHCLERRIARETA